MKFKLNKKLIPIEDRSEVGENELFVEIMTMAEFDESHRGTYHHELLMESLEHIQYSRVDILRSCIIGTVLIPDKHDLLEEEFGFGFYIHKDHLVLIDDTDTIYRISSRLPEIKAMETTLEARFFLELIEFFMNDDVLYLQRYEDQLVTVEEELVDHDIDTFHTDILKFRREILILNGYYQQLADMLEMLGENKNSIFNMEDCRMFRLASNRVDRLYDNTKMLREYTVQLREMYQSQIDIMQNKTMKVLTVVTTIFMPLTLIVGWYGMNFAGMPELEWKHGYLFVIILSLLVVVGEIAFFKWKKWFD